MKQVLDTNVILRFLVGDQPDQQAQAKQWFLDAQAGNRELWLDQTVVAECCFVLESYYKKSRPEISISMQSLISQRWIYVHEREALINLWEYYLGGLHFVDSFLIAWSRVTNSSLLTFDRTMAKRAEA